MKLKRKGIALIWVTLMSALIMVTIVSISIKVIPEKQILNARANTERALSVAETGLAELIDELRTNKDNVEDSLRDTGKYIIPGEPVIYGSGNDSVISKYMAKIVKEGSKNGKDIFGFYSLGVITDLSGNILARKVIKVAYTGNLPLLNDYALFTAAGIDAQNGTVNGDIFANTEIYFKNATLDGTAYCHTTDITGIPEDQRVPNQEQTDFPVIDIQKYKDLWKAFLNGTYPYNGTVAGYPNTSSPLVKTYLNSKFPGLYATGEPATQSQFESFFSDMRSGSNLQAAYLKQYIKKLVYYVKPDKIKQM